MEITNYIKIFDNCLDYKTLSKILKYINTLKFVPAELIHGKVTKEIRTTLKYDLNSINESLSDVHWHNYLVSFFNNSFLKYSEEIKDASIRSIEPLQILKYEKNCFYQQHVDHASEIPRTVSFIFILNNDYEGGELVFKLQGKDFVIENKPNRLVIWPSTFLFPHEVRPVKKGIRYSIVTWAL